MKFIKYKDGPHWWEWDTENMVAYNYHGGHHNINENALGDVIYCECESWHDLYKKTGYCALETGMLPHTAWLSPDGKMFVATAHEVDAESICEVIYGEEQEIWYAGDFLEERGWVRLTTSLMWEVREEYWLDKELTQAQLDILWDWCKAWNKKYPY